jgi:hypothetical protein
MTYFDANTWIGRWPFTFAPAFTARTLQTHLARHGIGRALVSPLDAVLQPEPGPANCDLLRATRGHRELEPVPVINPALGNWREVLATCAADERVRAVRVLPNYHDYSLRGPAMAGLVAELTERRLHLIVQMQLIDARHEHHAMTIKPVPPDDLALLLKRHRGLPVLASGLMRPDIIKLAPKFPALRCDLSFAEWHDTMENLLANVRVQQLAFASHTPFLITAAARAKLEASTLRAVQKRVVTAETLEHFLAER